ncbi:hypothetical protein PUATCC27989T_01868 [Phytobacter ursingii]|jgi:hypothetical protein|uniref:Uncharacterized protein n=2 Tax=Enterobacteriaceae TaxID=543 RepID=A0AAC8QNJ0_9ENTR|nr:MULTISPECIES: hypothetical protein [Enterobacteriaceae]MDU6682371.1 hypothetical protein [Enterobacteriaceae bacterium]HAT2206990.1 hypothetical protein [Kluyvera intermedia]AKL12091.1 hypothetical protein AB182_12550 [Phytobacter ursingii]MCL9671023.1 hypothetical protein [Citrobacter sp. MNAZ 1397]VTP14017.1 hypothetical protein PUATCC27989T_01868 [Phytobacter ursingii]
MSKVVVVLLPGGIPEYLTVNDNDTTITWAVNQTPEGLSGLTLPIETYFCEGEELHFARYEPALNGAMVEPYFHLSA